jgi:glycerol-3-phosphate O-acyltransferase
MERAARAQEGYLETLVNDTLYHERQRLERNTRDKRAKDDHAFYARVKTRMGHASERDLRALIEQMARRFAAEIVGNFDQRVYQLSTRAIPTMLSFMLSTLSPGRLMSINSLRRGLADHLVVQGEVDHAQALLDRGTLVVVPTHSSNLDSIVLGYAVYLIGLPPLLYGAGLNLFTNPLISFFMRNLGAYRVDRKKRAELYKQVLKEYAACAMEMGYHNLFFPGGTRSRSGAVERRLKKGLLGTAIRAYTGNLRAGKANPDIFLVPATLSYKLVLEAETLIDDHLKETGKARYIITDDEFSKIGRILNFFNNLMSLDSKIVVTFGEPIDLFGNKVDREGRSLDPHGRPIDTSRYVMNEEQPTYDDQRDMQYTNETADAIANAFLRENVLMSTNLVAYSMFNLLRRTNPQRDLYRLLRTGGMHPSYTMADLHLETDRVLQAVKELPRAPRLGQDLQSGDVQGIVADALKHYSIYHAHPAVYRKGDRVFHEDRNLLLYYGNRLSGYDLGRRLKA